ncbi:alpha/beta hydrolase [Pacificimonas sp. WHA3]|uniref:palmitoyl-protein hydrolase n=1 Tax=Pacificimonas pallii TaxID=2827236 RepID=A0ABS6SC15_9SPHN|nr:alpha/beta hydrolase [Pacificimonas pallii]MBV7255919.1 alpha/beta hydrolase [Pacificimonas pallii]
MTDIRYLERDGKRLAYRHRSAAAQTGKPTIVFLPGYMSDMDGGKASALDDWAASTGTAMLRLDYSGCGASDGAFADGTLDSWRDDVLHLIEERIEGPVLLVGSSMGGWLMVLVAMAIPARVAGMVGIAAAPDFTAWGFSDRDRAKLARGETLSAPSEYFDEPYITTPGFWLSGEANRVLGGSIGLICPVRLLHGQSDSDVPWEISVQLAERLASPDVQVRLVKDGDHRLSRDQDIIMLLTTVAGLIEG